MPCHVPTYVHISNGVAYVAWDIPTYCCIIRIGHAVVIINQHRDHKLKQIYSWLFVVYSKKKRNKKKMVLWIYILCRKVIRHLHFPVSLKSHRSMRKFDLNSVWNLLFSFFEQEKFRKPIAKFKKKLIEAVENTYLSNSRLTHLASVHVYWSPAVRHALYEPIVWECLIMRIFRRELQNRRNSTWRFSYNLLCNSRESTQLRFYEDFFIASSRVNNNSNNSD